jgi:exopolysaccharide production protein ExoQ
LAALTVLNWRVVVRLCADPCVLTLLCYVLLCLLSAVYSPVPLLSFISALSGVSYFGFACVLALSVSARSIWLTLTWALAGYLVINLLAAFISPDIAFLNGTRLQGVAGHPNSLARQATVFLMIAFGAYYRRDLTARWFAALFVLGTVTVLWTQSRTAMISCLIAGVCQLRRSWLLLAVLAAILSGALVYLSGFLTPLLDLVGRDGDADDALTMAGRTEIWRFVVHLIGQTPIIGHGFDSFEAVATPLWFGQETAAVEAHNSYLEVLFNVGILGFIPYVTGLGILLYRWLREPYPPRDLFVISLTIAGLTEADITSIAVLPTMVFFVIIIFDAARRMNLQSKRPYV